MHSRSPFQSFNLNEQQLRHRHQLLPAAVRHGRLAPRAPRRHLRGAGGRRHARVGRKPAANRRRRCGEDLLTAGGVQHADAGDLCSAAGHVRHLESGEAVDVRSLLQHIPHYHCIPLKPHSTGLDEMRIVNSIHSIASK